MKKCRAVMMGAVVLSGLVFSSTEVRANQDDELRYAQLRGERQQYLEQARVLRVEAVDPGQIAANHRAHGMQSCVEHYKAARRKIQEAHKFELKAMEVDFNITAVGLAAKRRDENLTEDQYNEIRKRFEADEVDLGTGIKLSSHEAELVKMRNDEKQACSALNIAWVE
ncbi:hypothetical protein AGMMS50233_07740 [Endomicrobiia bacterium]|nr:hypothetical protein AGMMS50233_07740 [Endomicrobiia bacterium]